MSIQERDYAAAAEAFKNANRIIDESLMAGDGTIPENELAKYAVPDGRYWLTEVQGVETAANSGQRISGTTSVVVVLPLKPYTPNHLRMYACYDGRDVTVIEEDGTTRSGTLVAARLTFRKADGRWRVLGYEKDEDGNDMNFQPVDECDRSPQ